MQLGGEARKKGKGVWREVRWRGLCKCRRYQYPEKKACEKGKHFKSPEKSRWGTDETLGSTPRISRQSTGKKRESEKVVHPAVALIGSKTIHAGRWVWESAAGPPNEIVLNCLIRGSWTAGGGCLSKIRPGTREEGEGFEKEYFRGGCSVPWSNQGRFPRIWNGIRPASGRIPLS